MYVPKASNKGFDYNQARGKQTKTGDLLVLEEKQTEDGDAGSRQLWSLHAQLVPHKETGDGDWKTLSQ